LCGDRPIGGPNDRRGLRSQSFARFRISDDGAGKLRPIDRRMAR
jgi:hypothetical protein